MPFLLDAAALVAGSSALSLVLVGATGSGADGQCVEALVRRAAGAGVVHVGAQPPAAVALILRCSDLFVLPSLFEGLPLTMLEAAGCGCPMPRSGLPTIRSWVPAQWIADGQFGLVAPLRTTDADVPVAPMSRASSPPSRTPSRGCSPLRREHAKVRGRTSRRVWRRIPGAPCSTVTRASMRRCLAIRPLPRPLPRTGDPSGSRRP